MAIVVKKEFSLRRLGPMPAVVHDSRAVRGVVDVPGAPPMHVRSAYLTTGGGLREETAGRIGGCMRVHALESERFSKNEQRHQYHIVPKGTMVDIFMYIYIYIYSKKEENTHTYIHISLSLSIYIYLFACMYIHT